MIAGPRGRLLGYYQRTLHHRPMAEAFHTRYLSALNIPTDARILDHGCGHGRVVGMLRQLGYAAQGQDVIRHSWWNQFGCRVVACPAGQDPGWQPASIDLVINQYVLHYLTPTLLTQHVANVARWLKPNGYWLIIEANAQAYGRRAFEYPEMHERYHVVEEARGDNLRYDHGWYEGFSSPFNPWLVNALRNQFALWPFWTETSDRLDRFIPANRRATWVAVLQKR
jgi:SAM-dependent methyltransferase